MSKGNCNNLSITFVFFEAIKISSCLRLYPYGIENWLHSDLATRQKASYINRENPLCWSFFIHNNKNTQLINFIVSWHRLSLRSAELTGFFHSHITLLIILWIVRNYRLVFPSFCRWLSTKYCQCKLVKDVQHSWFNFGE